MSTLMKPETALRAALYVKFASALADRQRKRLTEQAAATKQAANNTQPAIDSLLKAGALRPDEVNEARKFLQTHAGSLALLKNAAEELRATKVAAEKSANSLGAGIGQTTVKSASNSLTSSVVGLRGSDRRQSDLDYANVLGVNLG